MSNNKPAATPKDNSAEPSSIPEINFLNERGEDVSDLMPDLEAALNALRSDAPQIDHAPAQPAPEPELNYADMRLPITADGEEIEIPPVPKQEQPQPQPQQEVTSQDAALDPYQPDAPKQQVPADDAATGDKQPQEDLEPGEMVVDNEGKVRDAKTGRYVPHQALHAERVKNKDLRSELEKFREENARAQERLNMLTEIMQGQQQAAYQTEEKPPEPEADIDPEQDIFGAYNQLKKRHQDLTNTVQEIRQQTNQTTQNMQMTEHFRQDATRFMESHPDFTKAWQHLVDSRRAELVELGYSDQRAIDAQLATEQRMMMETAYKAGKSPSELFYKMSQARGWRTPEPLPEPTTATPAAVAQVNNAANEAQQPPQPQQQQPPQVDQTAAQKIQSATNGMQKNASLSTAGGTGDEGLTVAQLANMSEDDFINLAAKLGRKKLDALLGG